MKTRAVLLLALALVLVPLVAFAQNRDPLAGAWEQIASKNLTTGQVIQLNQANQAPVHVINSDGYYVQFAAGTGRQKLQITRDKQTREQLFEQGNMQGQYGTYRVAGNKLTRRIISAANPNNEGREVISEFRIEGDELIVTTPNAQGQNVESRFKRLRPTT